MTIDPHPHFVGKWMGRDRCGECGKAYADDKLNVRMPQTAAGLHAVADDPDLTRLVLAIEDEMEDRLNG